MYINVAQPLFALNYYKPLIQEDKKKNKCKRNIRATSKHLHYIF